jgi:hypothetical protein
MRIKQDYEIFRYVDDFFVFYTRDEEAQSIERHLTAILREFKLNLNTHKSMVIEKPIITSLTISKSRVQALLSERIEKEYVQRPIGGVTEMAEIFTPRVNANKLIIDFKIVLKETETSYQENLNYTFSAIEKGFGSLCKKFRNNRRNLAKQGSGYEPDEQVLVNALIGLLEFSFFIYSAAQRVNFTVRLTRSISSVVDELNELAISDDIKDQFFKYAHDNIIRILKANRVEKYREVETLYLILALKKLGRNYQIEPSTLARYFGFEETATGEYEASLPLSMFSITVLLLLVRNKKRYSKLKDALEQHIVTKFSSKKVYVNKDAEMLILYLDLITCPYVSNVTKQKIDAVFDLSPESVTSQSTFVDLPIEVKHLAFI